MSRAESVGTGNGWSPKTEYDGSYSSSSASDAVPNSHECDGRDAAKAATLSMSKPGSYGKARDRHTDAAVAALGQSVVQANKARAVSSFVIPW